MTAGNVNVLFCDGPLEGAWKTIREGTWHYEVFAPGPADHFDFDTAAAGVAAPPCDIVTYTIQQVPIRIFDAGGRLHIASCGYLRESGEAILRAILHRDVARELLGEPSRRPC